ncbi:MAG TPA: hypothetical protein VIH92_11835 [Solirubrobacteraceae bacterium]
MSTSEHFGGRRDWASQLRHARTSYFNGSASPQFVGALVLAIGIGILIGIAPSGGPTSMATPVAQLQAEERSILHIEEINARSHALETKYSKH